MIDQLAALLDIVVRAYREVQVERQKFFHDRRVKCAVYELGDRVYCRNEVPPQRGTSKKLSAKYDGPFNLIERMTIADSAGNEIFNYRIRPDGRGRARLVHASKLKKCYGPRVERIEPTRRRRNSAQATASPSESEQSTRLSTSRVIEHDAGYTFCEQASFFLVFSMCVFADGLSQQYCVNVKYDTGSETLRER